MLRTSGYKKLSFIFLSIMLFQYEAASSQLSTEFTSKLKSTENKVTEDSTQNNKSTAGVVTKDNLTSSMTLGQIDRIQASTMILEAQAKQAKVLKDIEGYGGINDNTANTSLSSPSLNNSAALPVKTKLPVIQEIYGGGQNLTALLAMPDGSVNEFMVGQLVPKTTLKIKSITSREVRVVDGVNEYLLSFN